MGIPVDDDPMMGDQYILEECEFSPCAKRGELIGGDSQAVPDVTRMRTEILRVAGYELRRAVILRFGGSLGAD